MQNKLKWYIRQSIANWLRNEIRKLYDGHNQIDTYLERINEINKTVDKEADFILGILDDRLSAIIKDLFKN